MPEMTQFTIGIEVSCADGVCGEVSRVVADPAIGHIQGLVVDPHDHQVTHVLLQEGHLWGRKDVAIPIKAVSRVGDTIKLNISKHEVQELPPVDFTHHGG